MAVSTNTNRPPLRAVDIGTLTNPHDGEAALCHSPADHGPD
jgi:hypothetical protein